MRSAKLAVDAADRAAATARDVLGPPPDDPELLLAVAEVFPHDLGQQLWWESYQRRTPQLRRDLIADLRRRQARNRLADGSSRQG